MPFGLCSHGGLAGLLRGVLGDRAGEECPYGVGITAVGHLHQLGDPANDLVPLHPPCSTHEDLWMPGLVGVLLCHRKFLEELFSGPHTCESDLDVFPRAESRELDEIARQVDDFDGLTHVRMKISPPFPMAPDWSTS